MSSFVLRIIAAVTMLIDHTAVSLFEVHGVSPYTQAASAIYRVMRVIGRIAFPLFCFQIVQGAMHTKSKWKYVVRLFLFALISEIPFNLALFGKWFVLGYQNVNFTLTLGLGAVLFMQWSSRWSGNRKIWGYVLSLLVIFVHAMTAELIRSDYGAGGVLLVAVMGILALPLDDFRPGLSTNRIFRGIVAAAAIAICTLVTGSRVEWFAMMALPFICLFDGRQGVRNKTWKWARYAYYPAHLTVLALIFVVPAML